MTSNANGSQGIFIWGINTRNVTISGAQTHNNPQGGILITSSNDTSGVTISGAAVSASSSATSVFVAGGAHTEDVTIEDSESSGSSGGFGVVGDNVRNVTVTGNTVTDVQYTGISVSGAYRDEDVLVSGNSVTNAMGTGVSVGPAQGALGNATIEQNIIVDSGYAGILVQGQPLANGNVVRQNSVSGSGQDGIQVTNVFMASADTKTVISRNSTFSNAELGIDLQAAGDAAPGVTPNDSGDGDSGPNDLLNFPVLTGDDGQAVTGTACANCKVELFLSDDDPSGYGEGKQFLADAFAPGGNFSIPICDENLAAGTKLTATATDELGNTSEFSLNRALVNAAADCPTPTPAASVPATTTATVTPAPSVTAPPTVQRQGDLDCDGFVKPRDALFPLLFRLDFRCSRGRCRAGRWRALSAGTSSRT